MSHGSCRSSYASAQLFRGRRNTVEASNWKSLKRIGILTSSVQSTCHFWRKSRRNASFSIFKASFLKEVSHKSCVFELQSFIFEGSLAEMNQLTTKSIESQINWQPKSFESPIRWQPNHLTLNSFESDIDWLSNQLNSAHSLPIGSLSLETSAAALRGTYIVYVKKL